MQQIQQLSLLWPHRHSTGGRRDANEPLSAPDRDRVRRAAAAFHAQLRAAERDGEDVDRLARHHVDALNAFCRELSPDDALAFMNMFTEESSSIEREWLARQRAWKPRGELSPVLVRVLMFAVTIFAIALAVRYAV